MKIIEIDQLVSKYGNFPDSPRVAYGHAERELSRELAEYEDGVLVIHCGLKMPTEEEIEYVRETFAPNVFLVGRFPAPRSRSPWINFPKGSGWRVHAIENPQIPSEIPGSFHKDQWKTMVRAWRGPSMTEGFESVNLYPGVEPDYLSR